MKQIKADYYLKWFDCGGGFIFERQSNGHYALRYSTASVKSGNFTKFEDPGMAKWAPRQLKGYLNTHGNFMPFSKDELIFLLM